MGTPWFYCEQLVPGTVRLGADESRHAGGARRLRPGDAVCLFDGQGRLADGVVDGVEDGRARGLRIALQGVRVEPAPRRRLTLLCAAPKGDRLSWMVEKCTELGVSELVLAEFQRAVVRLGAGHVSRLRRVAIEACKQCRRARLPRIEAPSASALDVLRRAVEAARGGGRPLILLADPGEPERRGWLRDVAAASEVIAVVGPEGGFGEGERAALVSMGAAAVRIAPQVLRVETAAVCVASIWGASLTEHD